MQWAEKNAHSERINSGHYTKKGTKKVFSILATTTIWLLCLHRLALPREPPSSILVSEDWKWRPSSIHLCSKSAGISNLRNITSLETKINSVLLKCILNIHVIVLFCSVACVLFNSVH